MERAMGIELHRQKPAIEIKSIGWRSIAALRVIDV